MFAGHRRSLFLSLSLGVAACNGGDPIRDFCEQQASCGCSMPAYPTADDCVTGLNAQTDSLKSFAESKGLKFDQGCYERSFSVFADLGCASDFTDSNQSCSSYCAIVHGDKPVGAVCTSEGFSDCAGNLFCVDGICQDFCEQQKPLGAGEVCAEQDGDLTTSVGSCGEGLYCDYAGGSLTCMALKGAGEACDPFQNYCQEGLACSTTDSTCGPPPGEGEPCVSICATNLSCSNGTCVQLPGEGAPCTDFGECADGLDCEDDLCTPPEPLVCELGSDGF